MERLIHLTRSVVGGRDSSQRDIGRGTSQVPAPWSTCHPASRWPMVRCLPRIRRGALDQGGPMRSTIRIAALLTAATAMLAVASPAMAKGGGGNAACATFSSYAVTPTSVDAT